MSRILHQTLMDYLDITEPDTKHKDIIVKHLENDITREIINENIEEIQIREKQAFKKTILIIKLENFSNLKEALNNLREENLSNEIYNIIINEILSDRTLLSLIRCDLKITKNSSLVNVIVYPNFVNIDGKVKYIE